MLRGYGNVGVLPTDNPLETYIACWEWGKYLGDEALAQGVDVCVSSWTRIAPNTAARAGQSRCELHELAAHSHGSEHERVRGGHCAGQLGICERGLRREHFRGARRQDHHAAARRVGAARRHAPCERGSTSGALFKIEVVETPVPRELLYIADEVFFTGTAAEVTPIRSVDRVVVGKGRRGPITEKLQHEFFAIVEGKAADRFGWLTAVSETVAAK